MRMAEKIKDAGHGKTGHIFPALESFVQRQLWPARLALLLAAFVVAILLGGAFLGYGSKLYRDWHRNRLLHLAASMLQEEKFNEATQTAREVVKLEPRHDRPSSVRARARKATDETLGDLVGAV